MSRKLLNKIEFKINGAKMRTFIHRSEPRTRKKSNDYIELEITSEEGEKGGWRMNGYDLVNVIWILSNAVLILQEEGIDMSPQSMKKL